jgi:osmotically-inducible protein OsmY
MKNMLIACVVGVLAVAAVGGCAVTSGQSSVGDYVDDSTITTRVKARYAQDPAVAATRINVETLQGTVQLSGFATSADEKAKAVELARTVPGVKAVRDSIVVRAPQG